jgi:hypothetical protein
LFSLGRTLKRYTITVLSQNKTVHNHSVLSQNRYTISDASFFLLAGGFACFGAGGGLAAPGAPVAGLTIAALVEGVVATSGVEPVLAGLSGLSGILSILLEINITFH